MIEGSQYVFDVITVYRISISRINCMLDLLSSMLK